MQKQCNSCVTTFPLVIKMPEASVSTIIIDDWYDNPDAIRRHASMHIEAEGTTGASKKSLESRREHGPKWEPYPGTRCKAEMGNLAWNFYMMERVIGCEIDEDRWCFLPSTTLDQNMVVMSPDKQQPVIKDTNILVAMDITSNGTFAFTDKDSVWRVHNDKPNTLAAIIYLEPDAPFDTGTSFYRHIETGATQMGKFITDVDKVDAYDPQKWEEIDRIGNVYNRCVIFDANRYHCATKYTGDRLFQTFFFNLKDET